MTRWLQRLLLPYGLLAVCLLPLVGLAAAAWWQLLAAWIAAEPGADPALEQLIARADKAAKSRTAVEGERETRRQLADAVAAQPGEPIATAPADPAAVRTWNTRTLLLRAGREFPRVRTPDTWEEDERGIERFLDEPTFKALESSDRRTADRLAAAIKRLRDEQSSRMRAWEDHNKDRDAAIAHLKRGDSALEQQRFPDVEKALSDADRQSSDLPPELKRPIVAQIARLRKRLEFAREATRSNPDLAKIVRDFKDHRALLSEPENAEFARLEQKHERQQQALLLRAFPKNGTATEVAAFVRSLPLDGFHDSVRDALRGELTKWLETNIPDFPEPDGWSVRRNDGHTLDLEEVTCRTFRDGGERTRLYVGAFATDPERAKADPREYRYFTRIADARVAGGHKKVLELYATAPGGRDAMVGRPVRWRAIEWRELYLAARKRALDAPDAAENWKDLAAHCGKLDRAAREYAEEAGDDGVRPTGSKPAFAFDFARPATFAPTVIKDDAWPALREVFSKR